MKNYKLKFLAVFLILFLAFNPLVVPFVWAAQAPEETGQAESPVDEEASESFQEEEQESTADEMPELAEEEFQDEGETTIVTGDAESQSEVKTVVNTNEKTIPGEVIVDEGPCAPPEIETDCSDEVTIANDNLAEVADNASSSATTGDNEIEGTNGRAVIESGDALAGASLKNGANINVETFAEEPEALESSESSGAPDEKEIVIENENEGSLTSQADVLADTGGNRANENEKKATIVTGDALAWTNLLNLLNINIVGSNFEILFLDFLKEQDGEVDLNKLWQEILEANGSDSLNLAEESAFSNLALWIENQNQANLENEVNVEALTGENQANENSDAFIESGDATALANVANFVNLNFVGAKFFLGVINILDSFNGNFILPRPERFLEMNQEDFQEESSQAPVVFSNQNQATIQDQVGAAAETGRNQEINNQGDNLIETGEAQAKANIFSLVNLNIWRNDWFFLIINNLGHWSGRIFGWSAPSAAEETSEGSQIYQLGLEEPVGEAEEDVQIEENLPFLILKNQNQATVKNKIQTSASTGQNQANENQGNVVIKTGRARSLANLFNFVNLNILGGRWFMGLINVLGSWAGDAIFAYPDLVVNLTNGADQVMVGETIEYTLSYQNRGYDEANEVWVEFELPQGMIFLGDSSGLTPTVSERTFSWFLGTLSAGEGGSFAITVEVDSNFSFEEPLSFWAKIIPPVQAAANEKTGEAVATALIGTTDPESDASNNSASVKTLVYLPLSSEADTVEDSVVNQEEPILEVSVKNNVGEFVYPGDTITFEIIIRNKGKGPAYETYLVQELFNGFPEENFGQAGFRIGTLDPGKGAKLTFGLKLANNGVLPAGFYHTLARAFGRAPNGNEVVSNEAKTEFEIRFKEIASLFEARALEERGGEILAAASECPQCNQEKDILPYVLLLFLSSMWLTNWGRMKLRKEKAA